MYLQVFGVYTILKLKLLKNMETKELVPPETSKETTTANKAEQGNIRWISEARIEESELENLGENMSETPAIQNAEQTVDQESLDNQRVQQILSRAAQLQENIDTQIIEKHPEVERVLRQAEESEQIDIKQVGEDISQGEEDLPPVETVQETTEDAVETEEGVEGENLNEENREEMDEETEELADALDQEITDPTVEVDTSQTRAQMVEWMKNHRRFGNEAEMERFVQQLEQVSNVELTNKVIDDLSSIMGIGRKALFDVKGLLFGKAFKSAVSAAAKEGQSEAEAMAAVWQRVQNFENKNEIFKRTKKTTNEIISIPLNTVGEVVSFTLLMEQLLKEIAPEMWGQR